MAKIYHKDHGFVITTDKFQIDELLAKGGELVGKCSEHGKPAEPEQLKGDTLENIEVNVSKSQAKRMKHQRYGNQ